ncbi:MAG: Uma2 family endonuclease [Desulfobacteraceae bacterium]|nr:Uma2 family endonuclease [Desulfobacteraceae bacterium]
MDNNTYQAEENMSPSLNHGYFQLSIGAALRDLGKFLVVTAVTIEINGKPYIPDILVYSKRPVNRKHDIIQMTELPMLAIEILSPTQGTKDILDKFEVYFAGGIRSCWLVEPVMGVVAVHSSFDNSQTFSSGDVVDEVSDIRLPIADIFN